MQNKDKGFRTNGVVIVENTDTLQENALAFQRLVAQQPQVVSTSFCNRTPAASNSIWMYSYRTPAMKQDMNLQTFPVDDQFISTLGIHLTTGRNFNKCLLSDTNSLILNESAVAALGLFNPIGATINGSEKVIGVVKDFNFASLHEKIGPVVLRFLPQGNALAIRIRGGQVSTFLSKLDQLSKTLLPQATLKISFLDDNFAKLAAKEQLLGKAITFFTVLAILLAMMGLIGLTLFTIERRNREIGIRKVLGAGSKDIIRLISTDFIRLAALSSLIALPLGWWLTHRWLENFAYRVPISVQPFLITECTVLIIAFSIISGLTLRAVITDPVKH
jgi:putative ABC transport system permease protein